MTAISPVPGRVCGSCTACCVVTDIRTPELVKPAGKPCDCLWRSPGYPSPEVGCSRKYNWPSICRDYFCGWRLMPQLGDEWRPDLCGVMLTTPGGETSVEMVAAGAIKIVLLERRAVHWVPLVEFVRDRAQTDIPIYVTVAGKEGQHTYTGFLNYELKPEPEDVVDIKTVIATLETAWDEISGMMERP